MRFKKLLISERFYFFLYLLAYSLMIGLAILSQKLMPTLDYGTKSDLWKLYSTFLRVETFVIFLCTILMFVTPFLFKALFIARHSSRAMVWIPLAIAMDLASVFQTALFTLNKIGFPMMLTLSTSAAWLTNINIATQLVSTLILLAFSLKYAFFNNRALNIGFIGYWGIGALSIALLAVYHIATTLSGVELNFFSSITSLLGYLTMFWQNGLLLFWIVLLITKRYREHGVTSEVA